MDTETTIGIKNTSKNKVKVILGFIIGFFIIGFFGYYIYNQGKPETKAKKVVDGYLLALKEGTSTIDFKKDNSSNDFVNILNYKYLRCSSVQEKTIKPETILPPNYKRHTINFGTYLRDSGKEVDKYGLNTGENDKQFENYLTSQKEKIKNDKTKTIIEETKVKFVYVETSDIVIPKEINYTEVILLYDLENTNNLGEKLYNKYYFKLDDQDGKFLIADFYK
ncbi:hypothetical protein [Desulforamulus ruminis]|uniref:hypothetical protein n=1 Tax=Desulforamulus ruminis TaxID=1564 RepID=UPI002354CC14|nr:hypothetical protein [Desulforamulus ruminis]